MIKGEHQQAMRELSEEEGVFTAAQAHRRGIPRDALSYACKTGVLERVSHGAYRLVGAPTTEAPDLIALWKLTDSGKFSRERTNGTGLSWAERRRRRFWVSANFT